MAEIAGKGERWVEVSARRRSVELNMEEGSDELTDLASITLEGNEIESPPPNKGRVE